MAMAPRVPVLRREALEPTLAHQRARHWRELEPQEMQDSGLRALERGWWVSLVVCCKDEKPKGGVSGIMDSKHWYFVNVLGRLLGLG